MRISKSTQERLQNILKAQGLSVRYEKGNFKGGYCIVMAQRTIVINKFYPIESKINTLVAVIQEIDIDESLLTDAELKLLKQIQTK